MHSSTACTYTSNFVNLPTKVGNVPVKLPCCKCNIFKLIKLNISDGIGSFMLIPSQYNKCKFEMLPIPSNELIFISERTNVVNDFDKERATV